MRPLVLVLLLTGIAALPAHADYHHAAAPVVVVQPVAFFQFVAPPSPLVPVLVNPALVQATAPAAPVVQTNNVQPADGWPVVPTKNVQPGAPAPSAAPSAYQVAALLQTRCAQCHSAPRGRGGVNLFDAGGAFSPDVSPRAIVAAVTRARNPMPLNSDRLGSAEIDLLKRWATAR